jgi:hypothetical protein
VLDVGGVLGGDDDVGDAGRLAVDVFDGDLATSRRGAATGELAGLADAGEFAAERWANMIGAGISSGVSSQA